MLNLITIAAEATTTGKDFCNEAAEILQFIGWILYIFKIAIPLLLIVWGSIDLGKAVVAQKEDEIKQATQILVKRAIFGVVIFFLPTIVGLIFNLIGQFSDVKDSYEVCRACIVSPGGDDCRPSND